MSRNLIEPNVVLTLCTDNIMNIPVIITDKYLSILSMTNITKSGNHHNIRTRLISHIEPLLTQFNVDMIILEQNKLFTDTFSKYPDPYILRNVTLSFGINISIEDAFWDKVKYILEIPRKDWTDKILGKADRYSIDLYKSHIMHYNFDDNTLNNIDINNYYKTICLSESVFYDSLMNKKYQVNKGES